MLSLLASVSRRQGSQGFELAARAYGSVVAAESGNPFTRYSNPFPAAIDHSPLLATLPETKVSTLACHSHTALAQLGQAPHILLLL